MDDFEILDGVPELFQQAEAEAAELQALNAEVEDNEGVRSVASGPDIQDSSSLSKVQDFIENNKYGQMLWKFSKWAAGTAAGACAAFGIIYGLNKAAAKNAQASGERVALSDYLNSVENNFNKIGIPWTDDLRNTTATDALAFPWIDASK
jgi:hypothetical protein